MKELNLHDGKMNIAKGSFDYSNEKAQYQIEQRRQDALALLDPIMAKATLINTHYVALFFINPLTGNNIEERHIFGDTHELEIWINSVLPFYDNNKIDYYVVSSIISTIDGGLFE